MKSTSMPSSPHEDIIFPSAYSFGGFVQVRTTASVRAVEAPYKTAVEPFAANEDYSDASTVVIAAERSHAKAR